MTWHAAAASEPDRPADVSLSAFVTNHFIAWLGEAARAVVRPHQPAQAASALRRRRRISRVCFDPGEHARADRARRRYAIACTNGLLRQPKLAAPTDPAAMAALQTQYYGMIAEADHQLGRVWAALEANGRVGRHT